MNEDRGPGLVQARYLSNDPVSLCRDIFELIVTKLPQDIAKQVAGISLALDDVGEINAYASVKDVGSGQGLTILVDPQLLEIMHTWCHIFGWAQEHLTEWTSNEDKQAELSQVFLELYVLQRMEGKLSTRHMSALQQFASDGFFIKGYLHNHFLLAAMIQFMLCHELAHLFFRERHFVDAVMEQKCGVKGIYNIPHPAHWRHEEEADLLGSELVFCLNVGQDDGYVNAMHDLAACLFMNFLNVYEFILAHFVAVVRPDALRSFQRSHPPTRERLSALLHLHQNSNRLYDIFRLNSVHQASLLNAVVISHFYKRDYTQLLAYGIKQPKQFVEEPGLFFYGVEELYAEIYEKPRPRSTPRGIESVLEQFRQ